MTAITAGAGGTAASLDYYRFVQSIFQLTYQCFH